MAVTRPLAVPRAARSSAAGASTPGRCASAGGRTGCPRPGPCSPAASRSAASPAAEQGGLERFVVETRRAELGHWLAAAPGVLFVLWNPPAVGADHGRLRPAGEPAVHRRPALQPHPGVSGAAGGGRRGSRRDARPAGRGPPAPSRGRPGAARPTRAAAASRRARRRGGGGPGGRRAASRGRRRGAAAPAAAGGCRPRARTGRPPRRRSPRWRPTAAARWPGPWWPGRTGSRRRPRSTAGTGRCARSVPAPGTWWLRCQTMPGPCMTARCPRALTASMAANAPIGEQHRGHRVLLVEPAGPVPHQDHEREQGEGVRRTPRPGCPTPGAGRWCRPSR